MKPIITQVILPKHYCGRSYAEYYHDGKAICAGEIRARIGRFLYKNLTQDLVRKRDASISKEHRLKLTLPFDFNVPTLRRSVRITSEMDAKIAEYAGIMQLPKRRVIWIAVVIEDSPNYPSALPLDEVLRQTGSNLSFIDFYGEVMRPVS